MSKSDATNSFAHSSKDISPWDTAIKDAEQMVEEAKTRIRMLRSAIKGFELLRDSGHPWPGTSKESYGVVNDAFKADSDKASV